MSVPEPVIVPRQVQAIGTLSINHVIEPASSDEPVSTPEETVDPLKALLKKKAIPQKKGSLGVKKLSTSRPDDTRIDSFDIVEKRTQQIAKDTAKQNEEAEVNSASDRIANMLRDSDANKPSPYRNTPAAATTATTSAPTSIYRMTQQDTSNSNKASNSVADSHAARQKYGNAKSISSDQYFGRDQENPAEVQAKLQKFGNSNAISSDMFYGRETEDEYYNPNQGRYENNKDFNMDKLKDSVSGFWTDLQKRVG
jgi:hypothetical protein